jgi:hypothetical protein
VKTVLLFVILYCTSAYATSDSANISSTLCTDQTGDSARTFINSNQVLAKLQEASRLCESQIAPLQARKDALSQRFWEMYSNRENYSEATHAADGKALEDSISEIEDQIIAIRSNVLLFQNAADALFFDFLRKLKN